MGNIRIMILGANGMLGHKLFLHLSGYANFTVYATSRSLGPLTPYCSLQQLNNVVSPVEAADCDRVTAAIDLTRPDMIINCIGIVKKSALAGDTAANIMINALFPHQIANICEKKGIYLIHISTDCVFSGNQGNYREEDVSDADDLYGRCKLLGEIDRPNCLTLRTSIIGHEINTRYGLIEWFLAQKKGVKGYTRHIFSGFPTIELARIIASFINSGKRLRGIYHLSAEPISKYELLKLVGNKYGHEIAIAPDAETSCNRALNSDRLREVIGFTPLPWDKMISSMHQDYLATSYASKQGGQKDAYF